LLADRNGLKHLRSKIDEILEGADEVGFDAEEVSTELAGIKIAGCYNPPKEETNKNKGLISFGCIALTLIALGLFVLGVWKGFELVLR
jgi:hypothetical protein